MATPRRKRPRKNPPAAPRRPEAVAGEQLLPLAVPAPVRPAPPAPRPRRALNPLNDLRRITRQVQDLERQADDLVHQAVLAGHSYVEVGAALGVTRQAARQRHQRRHP